MSAAHAFGPDDRIVEASLIEGDGPPPSAALDQERRIAVYELSEESAFRLTTRPGPYRLTVASDPGAFTLAVTTPAGDGETATLTAPVALLDPLVRDYRALCAAYREAVRSLPPAQIEALDAERKAAHDEAAEALAGALAPAAVMDAATARRLFTLISVIAPGAEGR